MKFETKSNFGKKKYKGLALVFGAGGSKMFWPEILLELRESKFLSFCGDGISQKWFKTVFFKILIKLIKIKNCLCCPQNAFNPALLYIFVFITSKLKTL